MGSDSPIRTVTFANISVRVGITAYSTYQAVGVYDTLNLIPKSVMKQLQKILVSNM